MALSRSSFVTWLVGHRIKARRELVFPSPGDAQTREDAARERQGSPILPENASRKRRDAAPVRLLAQPEKHILPQPARLPDIHQQNADLRGPGVGSAVEAGETHYVGIHLGDESI
jgi:hypothetical protein